MGGTRTGARPLDSALHRHHWLGEHAASLGDRAWRELLEKHHALVRSQLVRFRGREMDTAGDGFFASFDGPARAIRCARIVEGVRELQIEVRAGLHTGECELIDGKVAGIAVHTGARIASLAAPGEVLVSSTVKDLVAGSGMAFQEHGLEDLKEFPGSGACTRSPRTRHVDSQARCRRGSPPLPTCAGAAPRRSRDHHSRSEVARLPAPMEGAGLEPELTNQPHRSQLHIPPWDFNPPPPATVGAPRTPTCSES